MHTRHTEQWGLGQPIRLFYIYVCVCVQNLIPSVYVCLDTYQSQCILPCLLFNRLESSRRREGEESIRSGHRSLDKAPPSWGMVYPSSLLPSFGIALSMDEQRVCQSTPSSLSLLTEHALPLFHAIGDAPPSQVSEILAAAPGAPLLSPQEMELCQHTSLMPLQYLAIQEAIVRWHRKEERGGIYVSSPPLLPASSYIYHIYREAFRNGTLTPDGFRRVVKVCLSLLPLSFYNLLMLSLFPTCDSVTPIAQLLLVYRPLHALGGRSVLSPLLQKRPTESSCLSLWATLACLRVQRPLYTTSLLNVFNTAIQSRERYNMRNIC